MANINTVWVGGTQYNIATEITDDTLSVANMPADAEAVGLALDDLTSVTVTVSDGNMTITTGGSSS